MTARLEVEPSSFRGRDGILKTHHSLGDDQRRASADFWQTFAGVAGNVLEWYDFAIFGYLGDIIGKVFFPPQEGDWATIESFAVFGGAFVMRPIGGCLMGAIGDIYGRKKALVISIFLMAFPTFAMGCLPSYERAGIWSIVGLVTVRLLQGLSAGGQLVSSLVFTLEGHDKAKWGLFGSFVMAAANFGTLIGGIVGYILRASLTEQQLVAWGWRLPFLSGVLVSISGFYLKTHDENEPPPIGTSDNVDDEHDSKVENEVAPQTRPRNPILLAVAPGNRRSLLAATMVPMLWAGGFYLGFVWMAIYMGELLQYPVPHAFGVNSGALLVSVCFFFPVAGSLSDRFGRRHVMTMGGIGMGILAPIAVVLISKGNAFLALSSQSILGIALSCWGAPMCAWLVESFDPEVRLTSVAIGYNLAQAIAGGSAPAMATLLVDKLGPKSPGLFITCLAIISMVGLWFVAPTMPAVNPIASAHGKFEAVPRSETKEPSDEADDDEIL